MPHPLVKPPFPVVERFAAKLVLSYAEVTNRLHYTRGGEGALDRFQLVRYFCRDILRLAQANPNRWNVSTGFADC
jgi:hypothetical protein